jgi:hypothetical protein
MKELDCFLGSRIRIRKREYLRRDVTLVSHILQRSENALKIQVSRAGIAAVRVGDVDVP